MAFVLVQHLDPGHESMLTKLLSNFTAMRVTEVKEGMAVEPNHVYVIPPNTTMEIGNGTLHLAARGEPGGKHLPIDHFLRSLAGDQSDLAIGVILSGTASDGTLGLKAIKAEGGITFAQDCQSAKYDGMPRSAIAAGCVDFVLPPEGIALELARIGRNPYAGIALPARAEEPAAESGDELLQILIVLQKATGVNFTYYRYSTIKRRIARRMLLHKLESLQQYVKFLHENPAEPAALCDDILIHVTGFFREPEAFQALAEWAFPRILESKPPGEPIRVWVPGCSTGEEAYSIAMVLLEYLGDRAGSTPIQVFGTDISEASVEKARAGVYGESSLAEVSPERLRRFFFKVEGGYQVAKSMRDMCVFARQDLAKDPPFSRLDFISCRNVLIYMAAALQNKVMAVLHYALRPTGFLMLGKSESASRFADLFTVVDRKHKICSKVLAERGFDLSAGVGYEKPIETAARKPEAQARLDVQAEADRIILSQYAPAGLVVNENLHILHFRGQSNAYLSPSPGEASLGLLRMVRPELAVELRTAIHRAKKEAAAVRKEGIRVRRDGLLWDVRVDVVPIQGERGERLFLILFQDTPVREPGGPPAPGERPARGRRQWLEGARLRRELERTKEYLQSIIQEQEATNEELKSANEEALSANEELQSTNEELETAKEELQSANEELVTLNEQLQKRNAELGQLNDDLTNVLGGVDIPILILSGERRIRRFTPQAETLLNLLPGDVGRSIDNIRTNIDVPDLAGLVAEVVETTTIREREVQDREGRWYSMRVRPYRTTDNRIDGAVLIFIDIDAAKRIHLELQREQTFTAAVLESAAALVVVTDMECRIIRFNLACRQLSGYSFEEVEGKFVWEVLVPPEEAETVKQMYKELAEGRSARQHEYHWVDRNGRRHLISWHSTAVADPQGATPCLVRVGVDITEARQAERALQQSEQMLRQSQQDLRTLTAGLLDAQEEERRRIARDLHDDIGQRLAALAIQVMALQQEPGISPDELSSKLEELQKLLKALSEDLHRTARDLHPFTLAHLGLEAALQSYCEEFSRLRRIEVRFEARALTGTIPPEAALCVYRVVQEALGNIAKHSGTKRAVVSISASDDALDAAIRDDGCGFDVNQARGKGLGLINMEERVRHAGGSITIQPRRGDGTRIEIRIPLAAGQPALPPESSAP